MLNTRINDLLKETDDIVAEIMLEENEDKVVMLKDRHVALMDEYDDLLAISKDLGPIDRAIALALDGVVVQDTGYYKQVSTIPSGPFAGKSIAVLASMASIAVFIGETRVSMPLISVSILKHHSSRKELRDGIETAAMLLAPVAAPASKVYEKASYVGLCNLIKAKDAKATSAWVLPVGIVVTMKDDSEEHIHPQEARA